MTNDPSQVVRTESETQDQPQVFSKSENFEADLGRYITEHARIRIPNHPVPVMAVIDGERIQIGTGTIDQGTGVFKATVTHEKGLDIIGDYINRSAYSINSEVSELELLKGPDLDDE